MNGIEGTVHVHVTWVDAANEWQIEPYDLDGSPLQLTVGASVDSDVTEEDHARGHAVTADDLAHMLGSALAHATRDVSGNIATGQRPPSPALVDMLDGAIKEELADVALTDAAVRGLIRRLLPIVASVDMNAHLRGAAEAQGETSSSVEMVRGVGRAIVPGEAMAAMDTPTVLGILHAAFNEAIRVVLKEMEGHPSHPNTGFNHLHVTLTVEGEVLVEDQP